MKRFLNYSLLAGLVILYSCKKDNTNTAIQGTYQVKYLTSKTNSTITGSDGEKSVTTSDYTTINNGGTFAFDNSKFTATGVTYTINTTALAYFYQDNQLIDSVSSPFIFTVPAISSGGTYQLIGSDSIYFPGGVVTTGLGGSGSAQNMPSGGLYTLHDKLLTITETLLKDSTFTDSGITYQINESAVSSIVLEKQ